jgi:hypothetical protein
MASKMLKPSLKNGLTPNPTIFITSSRVKTAVNIMFAMSKIFCYSGGYAGYLSKQRATVFATMINRMKALK